VEYDSQDLQAGMSGFADRVFQGLQGENVRMRGKVKKIFTQQVCARTPKLV